MCPAALCRDCFAAFDGADQPMRRCPTCRSPRTIAHAELDSLAIAHLDCDAFYASVEKRDDPALADRPVIIGGGKRGVVSTACYIARLSGVKSAMPMFKALRLCPEAVVVRPRMEHYVAVSRQIRAMMLELTPLVEPLSLDEAFLDLSGTERLHGATPAGVLARVQARIERELGLTVSIGLSHNKFLAKIASERDKPRGFCLIGRAETAAFLAAQPARLIWGVGAAAAASLEAEGLRTLGDIRARDRAQLIRRFGAQGDRLWRLAQGEDARPVSPDRAMKSISHETTFDEDIGDPVALRRQLWALCEQLSARAKARDLGGSVVTLKLRRADFRLLSRRQTLDAPTQMADRLYRTARPMLDRDVHSGPFRLIGIGLQNLSASESADPGDDLLDAAAQKRLAAERATDRIRARFGPKSIRLGRSLP